MVEIGTRPETRADRTGLTLRSVVVEHRDHGDLLGGRAIARVAEFVAIVAALVGHVIAVAPASLLQPARKIVVNLQNVRDARVAELAEELRVGVARESTAGFAESGGLVITIRVNQSHALAEHVVRVLEFLLRRVVAVVAVGVGYTQAGSEPAGAGRIETGERRAGIAESVVEFRAKIVVDQTHACVPIATVAGRHSEVLAEDHGIIATLLVLEDRVAVIGVAETARAVELALHLAQVTGVACVLVQARLRAEKVVRHVLHRVEAQAVGLEAVHFPAHSPLEIRFDVFDVSRAVFEDVGLGMIAQLLRGRVRTERGLGPVDQPSEIDRIAVFVLVVLLRTVQVADETVFRVGRALARSEVLVGAVFLRDVDEVGQSEVLHLPSASPIARVVPLAIETILGFAQVEILGHHARISLSLAFPAGRRVLVVTRDVERPVVHDVVEIDADTEAVRHFHHVLQIRLGAVAGAHRVALVFLTEVERIPHVVTDRESARALGRRREPERSIAGLGQFGHFARDLVVRDVEELEQTLGTSGRELTPRQEETARHGDNHPPPQCRGELHLGTLKCPRFFSVVKVERHGFTEKTRHTGGLVYSVNLDTRLRPAFKPGNRNTSEAGARTAGLASGPVRRKDIANVYALGAPIRTPRPEPCLCGEDFAADPAGRRHCRRGTGGGNHGIHGDLQGHRDGKTRFRRFVPRGEHAHQRGRTALHRTQLQRHAEDVFRTLRALRHVGCRLERGHPRLAHRTPGAASVASRAGTERVSSSNS